MHENVESRLHAENSHNAILLIAQRKLFFKLARTKKLKLMPALNVLFECAAQLFVANLIIKINLNFYSRECSSKTFKGLEVTKIDYVKDN